MLAWMRCTALICILVRVGAETVDKPNESAEEKFGVMPEGESTFKRRLHNQRRIELVAHESLNTITQSHESAADTKVHERDPSTSTPWFPAINEDFSAFAHHQHQHHEKLLAAEQGYLPAIMQLAFFYVDEHVSLTSSILSSIPTPEPSSKDMTVHNLRQLQQLRTKARALALWAWYLETGGVSLSILGYHHIVHPPPSSTGFLTDLWLDWMLGRTATTTSASANAGRNRADGHHVAFSDIHQWHGTYGVAPLLLLARIECLEALYSLLYSTSLPAKKPHSLELSSSALGAETGVSLPDREDKEWKGREDDSEPEDEDVEASWFAVLAGTLALVLVIGVNVWCMRWIMRRSQQESLLLSSTTETSAQNLRSSAIDGDSSFHEGKPITAVRDRDATDGCHLSSPVFQNSSATRNNSNDINIPHLESLTKDYDKEEQEEVSTTASSSKDEYLDHAVDVVDSTAPVALLQ